MKKYIFLLLIVSIAISFVACNSGIAQTTTDNAAITTTTTANTTANTTNVDMFLPTEPQGFPILYCFSSIKDMHTYISTGSTNDDDYSELPHPSFDIFPDNKTLLEQGYRSINEYFEFDENDFKAKEIRFSVSDLTGRFKYVYEMDNVMITIQPAIGDNIVECYSKVKNKDLSEKDFEEFSSEIKIDKGQILRENNEFELIYKVANGRIEAAHFLIGNTYIKIGIIWSVENGTDEEAHKAFSEEEKYEPFAKFFSDDDEVVKKAFESIKQNLEAAS